MQGLGKRLDTLLNRWLLSPKDRKQWSPCEQRFAEDELCQASFSPAGLTGFPDGLTDVVYLDLSKSFHTVAKHAEEGPGWGCTISYNLQGPEEVKEKRCLSAG